MKKIIFYIVSVINTLLIITLILYIRGVEVKREHLQDEVLFNTVYTGSALSRIEDAIKKNSIIIYKDDTISFHKNKIIKYK